MRFTVRWQQTTDQQVDVDVDLDVVARWASETLPMRAMRAGTMGIATPEMILQSMDANVTLRDKLIQLWAAAHATPRAAEPRVRSIVVDEPPRGGERH